jgi:hypothetical protein
VREKLLALERPSVSRDLAPEILARVRAERAPARWPRVAAMAAACTLVAAIAVLTLPRRNSIAPAPDETAGFAQTSADRAIDWLCAHQDTDGSWDARKWGGQARFQVALTALPMLAIEAGEVIAAPARASAVRRATAWLRSQQHADGTFGAEFSGAPYNRSIATLALVRASGWEQDPPFAESVNRALDALLARQTADGGWGYEFSARADRSITEWHVEALAAAMARGRADLRPHLDRAHAWLASYPGPTETRDEPPDSPSETLPASNAGALDFYGAYFLAARWQELGDRYSQQRLAGLRRTILMRQIAGGSDAGTWSADDRWGRAGGRLYSTALAAMTLRGR